MEALVMPGSWWCCCGSHCIDH